MMLECSPGQLVTRAAYMHHDDRSLVPFNAALKGPVGHTAGGGAMGEGVRLLGRILQDAVPGRAGPLCQTAAQAARSAQHWPQGPGTPLLLQAHRRHAHRHLLDGDVGEPQPQSIDSCSCCSAGQWAGTD